MNRFTSALALSVTGAALFADAQTAFVNEINYDKDDTSKKFIEVVGSPAADEATLAVTVTVTGNDGSAVSGADAAALTLNKLEAADNKLFGVFSLAALPAAAQIKIAVGAETADTVCYGFTADGEDSSQITCAKKATELSGSNADGSANAAYRLKDGATASKWLVADYVWEAAPLTTNVVAPSELSSGAANKGQTFKAPVVVAPTTLAPTTVAPTAAATTAAATTAPATVTTTTSGAAQVGTSVVGLFVAAATLLHLI